MKPALLITFFVLTLSLTAKAQKKDTVSTAASQTDTLIYSRVEEEPTFHGGLDGFYSYLSKTIRYPRLSSSQHIEGTVYLSVVIEKDGSLSNVKIYKSVSDDINAEAIRVVKASPKWKPGTHNGVPVRVRYIFPIRFSL